MPDILHDLGHVALGSRLKRLAERILADATAILDQAGLPIQPSHLALLAALDRYGPMSISEAVATVGFSQPAMTRTVAALRAACLITTDQDPGDARAKQIDLTNAGRAILAKTQEHVWPKVSAAVSDLTGGREQELLALLTLFETHLAERSMLQRVTNPFSLIQVSETISPDLAKAFYDINAAWISAMFKLEQHDVDVLSNPQAEILDRGGEILFIATEKDGVVGTCALMPTEDGAVELTKMGVLDSMRGQKAGEYLLAATLARAEERGIETLFLLTNHTCEAAIHLYEKLGFVHDPDIMDRYGCSYERCDVAMRYRPQAA